MIGDELHVACIGECMIELRHRGPTDLDMAFGGDTLNTAAYLARLTRHRRITVDYATALGDDPYSDWMIDAWRAEGIGTRLVTRVPGGMPGLYLIRTDAAGERSFFYYRTAAAARDMLRGAEGERLASELRKVDLLYLSGITLSILDTGQRVRLRAIADRVRHRGGKVAFDSNFRPRGWPDRQQAQEIIGGFAARADYVLATLDDEQSLFGDEGVEPCMTRLAQAGAREIVVKLGADGCRVQAPGCSEIVAAQRVDKVVDSTAAGDSFNAAYLAARLCGDSPTSAAQQGNRLAARVVTHRGAIMPADEMRDLVL